MPYMAQISTHEADHPHLLSSCLGSDVLGLASTISLPDEARTRLADVLVEAAEIIRNKPGETGAFPSRPPGL